MKISRLFDGYLVRRLDARGSCWNQLRGLEHIFRPVTGLVMNYEKWIRSDLENGLTAQCKGTHL